MEKTTKGSNANRKKEEAAREFEHLKSLVGSLQTEEELVSLAHYLTDSLTEEEYERKRMALSQVFKGKSSGRQSEIMVEMVLFRTTFRTSASFLGKQPISWKGLVELCRAADLWMALAANNALGTLIEGASGVKIAKDNGGTQAEVFIAFLNAYKEQRGFETWTVEKIIGMRHSIYVVVKEFLQSPKIESTETKLPPAKRQKLSSSIASNGTSNSDIQVEQSEASVINSSLSSDDLVTSASKVIDENYQASQDAYLSKEMVHSNAVRASAKARSEFPPIFRSSLKTAVACLDGVNHEELEDLSLDKAQALLHDMGTAGDALKKCLDDYIEPLTRAEKAMEELDAAQKERSKWEAKKKVVEQAAEAIRALKELMK